MAKMKSHEQFIQQLLIVNPSIEIVSKYSGAQNKIRCKCQIDGYEWSAYPSHLLNGQQCPECHNLKRRSPEDFVTDLLKINPNIISLEQFQGVMKPIRFKCLIDGNEWVTTPC